MAGYIGERAKRRKRNTFLIFLTIILIIIFYYLLPLFKSTDIKPTDDILPSDSEIFSSEIIFTVEDLQLKIFDKEQKIIFRNRQIEKLKDQIKFLSTENKDLIESIENLNNVIDSSSSNTEDFNELIAKEVYKFKKDIIKLENEKIELLNLIERNKYETDLLNKDFKIIFNKNLKLQSLNKNNDIKINELEDIIEEQNLIIELSKSKMPHS